MSNSRVVVTGLGILSAQGICQHQVWDNLKAGRCGLRPMTLVDRSLFRFSHGGEVPNYSPQDHFDEKTAAFLDRFAQFAVVAAREAVRESGIEWTPRLRSRTAVVTGSCVGGQSTQDEGFIDLYRLGKPRVHPLLIPRIMANSGASQITMEMGVTGPAYTVSTACSSANHAIGQAFWMVRSGMCDAAICGGSEAPFSTGILKAWEAMRVVAPDFCRPFSRDRKGLSLGEGGAMLFIEREETAKARGAKIIAEIAGFGMTSDAYHVTQPCVEGPAAAMEAALQDAGLAPEDVGYLNAHGTGTLVNDPVEAAAIRKVFGSSKNSVLVSSTKSMHGHALGAAGALEAVATILALKNGIIPPTINLTDPDPECALDHVANVARKVEVEAALSNSFAFGGLNAVLAFRRA